MKSFNGSRKNQTSDRLSSDDESSLVKDVDKLSLNKSPRLSREEKQARRMVRRSSLENVGKKTTTEEAAGSQNSSEDDPKVKKRMTREEKKAQRAERRAGLDGILKKNAADQNISEKESKTNAQGEKSRAGGVQSSSSEEVEPVSAPKKWSVFKKKVPPTQAATTVESGSSSDEQLQGSSRRHRKSKEETNGEYFKERGKGSTGQLSPMRRRRGTNQRETNFSKRRRDRMITENQPELHIIGEILGGSDFGSDGHACAWSVEYGSSWHHLTGDQSGQTHVDLPGLPSSDHVWAHPLDVHFASDSIQGWPRLQLQVFQVDAYGRYDMAGYAFINIPCTSGSHTLTIPTWRPLGNFKEELQGRFLGGKVRLTSQDMLYTKAWAERCRLKTISSGKIHIHMDILTRNFPQNQLSL